MCVPLTPAWSHRRLWETRKACSALASCSRRKVSLSNAASGHMSKFSCCKSPLLDVLCRYRETKLIFCIVVSGMWSWHFRPSTGEESWTFLWCDLRKPSLSLASRAWNVWRIWCERTLRTSLLVAVMTHNRLPSPNILCVGGGLLRVSKVIYYCTLLLYSLARIQFAGFVSLFLTGQLDCRYFARDRLCLYTYRNMEDSCNSAPRLSFEYE